MQQASGQGYTTLSNILATLPVDGRFTYSNYGRGLTEMAAQGARAIQPEEIKAAVWHSTVQRDTVTETNALIDSWRLLSTRRSMALSSPPVRPCG